MAASFLAPILQHASARLVLLNSRTDRALARHLEAAFDSRSRKKGLLGRTELPTDTAIILAPCSAIHTCFMQFPIDVAFVDRRGVVVKTIADLQPWRIGCAIRAHAVVELPAGTLAKTGTTAGDSLLVRPQ